MIRQLGKPTWFCSFSAAETRWPHLLKILGRLVEKKQYTDDEISKMTWQKKSELIRKDPVTCARNFEHMFRLFLNTFLRSKQMPIGEIEDFFYRVEFQQRGSPHIHALFWVKDAPQLGKDSNSDITAFGDKYVSCANDGSGAVNADLVNVQLHRHAKTCKRKGQNICRFNFPIFPMPSTMILKPLDLSNLDNKEIEHLKTNLTNITNLLTDMKLGSEINFRFDTFLKKLNLTVDSYILSIRYSLKRDTLFLKRSPSDIRINMYNKDLLKAWRANLDIQYVLDPYSCAAYILSYITKGQRGMSRLLEKACQEAKSGNKDLISQVRHIGNKFLNAVEISAQEAVYLTLQLPLRCSSRYVQFINTTIPEERTFLLKPHDQLQDLPNNSNDIESDNIIKRYQRRPCKLENVCLADFVAWYNCIRESSNAKKPTKCMSADNFLPENDFEANSDDEQSDIEANSDVNFGQDEFHLRGGYKLVKRSVPKIIRSVRYNKNKHSENYFREQLMLYMPWRNEEEDLIYGCQTFEEKYMQLEDVIVENRYNYEFHTDILQKALEDLDNIECNEYDGNIAPNAQHIEEQDRIAEKNPTLLRKQNAIWRCKPSHCWRFVSTSTSV